MLKLLLIYMLQTLLECAASHPKFDTLHADKAKPATTANAFAHWQLRLAFSSMPSRYLSAKAENRNTLITIKPERRLPSLRREADGA
jgi:hypothetical protein